jgi:hypothetical protein
VVSHNPLQFVHTDGQGEDVLLGFLDRPDAERITHNIEPIKKTETGATGSISAIKT